jgi:CRISPR-associated protein Cas2
MTVIVVTAARDRVRGRLSRWMLEPSAGVFVGDISAATAERLWKMVCAEAADGGSAWIARPAANEQGFHVRTFGGNRDILEMDGLSLVRRNRNAKRHDQR